MGANEGMEFIWFAVIWTIWLARNEKSFRGKATGANSTEGFQLDKKTKGEATFSPFQTRSIT